MLVGAADIFANHPFLVVGPAGAPDLEEVDWDDESPAWTNGEHLLIGTFGRAGLVRVTIWESAMPLIGEVVFDGQLEVDDSEVSIGDLEELTRFTMQVGESGPQRIVVCVDDPGYASRISIGFDLGEQVGTLTSVAGHPLPPVLLSAKGELSWSEEFGLILDGHDDPRARLAAAIKLMPVPGYAGDLEEDEQPAGDQVPEERLAGGQALVGEDVAALPNDRARPGEGAAAATGAGTTVPARATDAEANGAAAYGVAASSTAANEAAGTDVGTTDVEANGAAAYGVAASSAAASEAAANDVQATDLEATDLEATDVDEDGENDVAVDVSRLVEWLRGLGGTIRLADAEACGDMIADRMRAAGAEGTGLPDGVALAIATDVLERLGLR